MWIIMADMVVDEVADMVVAEVADMEVDKVANMEVDKVANMEVDKMADMEKLTEAALILVSRYFRQFAFVWWRYPASSPSRSNKIF